MAAGRRLGNLELSKTVFFVCDIQERFRPAIEYFTEIVEVSKRLLQGAKILSIPCFATEQYPKGLGSTVEELDISNHTEAVVSKTKFSMMVPDIQRQLENSCSGDVQSVVLFGIVAHVCIQQTVIDLLGRGYDVHVVADATSSRSHTDRMMMAFERFRHSGAIVTTSEAVLLQLVGDKDHPNFKQIQGLIKTSAPNTGLYPASL